MATTNPGPPELSIVVPVYRNRETLLELHSRLTRILKSHSYEIIFVDDGCPDRSVEILESIARTDPMVTALSHERNRGQIAAVFTGLRCASGKCVIVMDADLQDPPEAIPLLLAKRNETRAAIFAGKRGRYESSFRLFTSRVYKSFLHLAGGLPLDAGLYVLLERELIDYLLSIQRPCRSMLAMLACSGMKFVSIPVERRPRSTGVSSYNFEKRLRIAIDGVRWIVGHKLHLRNAR